MVTGAVVRTQVNLEAVRAREQLGDQGSFEASGLTGEDVQVRQVNRHRNTAGQQGGVFGPRAQQVAVRVRARHRVLAFDCHGAAEEIGAPFGVVEQLRHGGVHAVPGVGRIGARLKGAADLGCTFKPLAMTLERAQVAQLPAGGHGHVGMQAPGCAWPPRSEGLGGLDVENALGLRDDLYVVDQQAAERWFLDTAHGLLGGSPVREAWPAGQGGPGLRLHRA
ncbi:hypothetical protein Bpfe_031077 [Biomphalaria pfeifferi]|uniref:Uncharacterized protein n=1 Tax=Biomphalaria pfeifferi TaxID=112525 RepID=A0AAD8ANJ0_BIOPF|nr:hypothetical protein Bpfe_031077 [Biomphalaria pfeifferi]